MLRRFVISGLLFALTVSGQARTRPHYGGTLRIETEADPWQKPRGVARRLVLEGLTSIDDAGMVRPSMAIQWKSENADHRWQFQLRHGVHFHDGSPLTAASVVASMERSCNGHCPWTAVRAVGSEVVFTAEEPMPDLPSVLAAEEYLVEHSSANGGVDGTGPFVVSSFSNGVLMLTAHVDHWAGRPFVDSVELRTRRSLRDQWEDLEADRTDIVEVPAENLRQAKQQKLKVIESRPVDLLCLQLESDGQLKDVNLRRAIGLAIDRSALFNVIYQKQGEVTGSLIPNWMTGYSFLFSTARDVEKARALGGGSGVGAMTLAVEGHNSAMELAAGRIALNLRDAGFNVQSTGTGSRSQPDMVLRLVPLQETQPGAALELFERLFANDKAAAEGPAEELFKSERDFLSDTTVIPLVYLSRAYGVGPRVRDLRLNADGSANLADVSLVEAK